MSAIETSVTVGDPARWRSLPDQQTIARTIEAVRSRGVNAEFVPDRQEALRVVAGKIPEGAEIMTGGSTTLEHIGFAELLRSGKHRWKNLREQILAEKDPARQRELRKKAAGAEYFIGSVHAVAETGEIVVASATGSQLPAYAFTSDNVIWVVGAQKIVPSLEEGLKRVREHSLPMESARMRSLGHPQSMIGKLLIFERERVPGRNMTMILVNEKLGF